MQETPAESGRVDMYAIFQFEKERRRENGVGAFRCSFPSAEVWFKSTFQTIIYIQIIFQ